MTTLPLARVRHTYARARSGAFRPAAVAIIVFTTVVGSTFPLVAPYFGIPRSAIGPRYVTGCVLTGLVVGLFDVWLARTLVSRSLATLAGQLDRITGMLRGRVDWRTGEVRALSLPLRWSGQLDRVAAAVNELLDALEHEHAFRSVVDSSGDLVLLVDGQGLVSYTSDSIRQVLGLEPADLIGRPLAAFVHAGDLEPLLEMIDTTVPDPEAGVRPRVRIRGAGGGWRVLELVVSLPRDSGVARVLLSGRDVTDQVDLERELTHQAMCDVLTGLANRTALMQAAQAAVAAASQEHPVAVLMIDLDRFKVINDSLGHAFGDQLLAQVGPRLRSTLRPTDTIARLGGDEFAVLLPDADEEGARMVADRLTGLLEDSFVVHGMDLHVEASIGIAVSHGPVDRGSPATVEALLRESDIAMYRAKEARSGVAAFDPSRDEQNASRLELSAELRHGITDGQLVLHFQPVVAIDQGRLAGVEALVRWQHPTRGLLPPGAFLPLAEETGLIVPLSQAVLEAAVAQAAQWWRAGRAIQVAVNLSPRWLQGARVPDLVRHTLDEHALPAEMLRLEITESVVLADSDEILMMLNRLREMGVGLSLDDFGTGYSSMTRLRSMPVDELKVDRAFVQAMTTTPEDAIIVRAAIELGHNLGMTVVAEGIEDLTTLEEVVAAGCHLVQGFYFSKPLPADQLWAWQEERCPARRVDEPAPDASSGSGADLSAYPRPA